VLELAFAAVLVDDQRAVTALVVFVPYYPASGIGERDGTSVRVVFLGPGRSEWGHLLDHLARLIKVILRFGPEAVGNPGHVRGREILQAPLHVTPVPGAVDTATLPVVAEGEG